MKIIMAKWHPFYEDFVHTLTAPCHLKCSLTPVPGLLKLNFSLLL